jgi:hypothetical protein
MSISGEGKISTVLALLGLGGTGAIVILPGYTWIGWALLTIAAVGFLVLGCHHWSEKISRFMRSKLAPLATIAAGLLITIAGVVWLYLRAGTTSLNAPLPVAAAQLPQLPSLSQQSAPIPSPPTARQYSTTERDALNNLMIDTLQALDAGDKVSQEIDDELSIRMRDLEISVSVSRLDQLIAEAQSVQDDFTAITKKATYGYYSTEMNAIDIADQDSAVTLIDVMGTSRRALDSLMKTSDPRTRTDYDFLNVKITLIRPVSNANRDFRQWLTDRRRAWVKEKASIQSQL